MCVVREEMREEEEGRSARLEMHKKQEELIYVHTYIHFICVYVCVCMCVLVLYDG